MNFLKQLASMFTPRTGDQSGDPGLYYYLRCNRCGEVIRVRINPMSELTTENDGTRFVRKVVIGKRCYNRIEGEFRYKSGHKLIDSVISGGELVGKDEYDAQQRQATAE